MRIGVSSRGNAWVSMGPLGWLVFILFVGPFWLAFWTCYWTIWALVTFTVWLTREIHDFHQRNPRL